MFSTLKQKFYNAGAEIVSAVVSAVDWGVEKAKDFEQAVVDICDKISSKIIECLDEFEGWYNRNYYKKHGYDGPGNSQDRFEKHEEEYNKKRDRVINRDI